ncbi:hypothetical protein D9613_004201 [Agrocybe pediades]|uniref:Copper transport protein n=1 Tax=Agrocybe pediades TaxID=84607 RepID=A0A8H4QJ56_9AGAR|nr:hypothetical protein D9613_004201 [Agrocybe pediades]
MTFEPHLHWSFNNEHVLLPTVTLTSFWSFLAACLLVASICLSERFLTFVLEKQWTPRICRRSRTCLAMWRTGLYSIATFLRLCYMLAGMTFHVGLIFCIILSLSIGQFLIELRKLPKAPDSLSRNPRAHESSLPLLSDEEPTTYPLKPVHNKTRPRSKSKPDDIFIHPTESNIARADAVALELGLAGETDRVAYSRPKGSPAWEIGKGRDIAREMLRGSNQQKRTSHNNIFLADDDESDSSQEAK